MLSSINTTWLHSTFVTVLAGFVTVAMLVPCHLLSINTLTIYTVNASTVGVILIVVPLVILAVFTVLSSHFYL